MFNTEVPNRPCLVADGCITMKQLKITLKIPTKEKKNEELEECINSIFNNTTDCEVDGKEVTDNTDVEAIEVIPDDYNYTKLLLMLKMVLVIQHHGTMSLSINWE